MSSTDELLQHLPRVRRFGFMLLGSMKLTDALIEESLKILLANREAYLDAEDKLNELFRVFCSVVPDAKTLASCD